MIKLKQIQLNTLKNYKENIYNKIELKFNF